MQRTEPHTCPMHIVVLLDNSTVIEWTIQDTTEQYSNSTSIYTQEMQHTINRVNVILYSRSNYRQLHHISPFRPVTLEG